MSFTKPPFFQWPVKPAASRGLGDEELIEFIDVITNGGTNQTAFGWFDYTLPPGYVAGAGLSINVQFSQSGTTNITVFPATGNGGSLTPVGQGVPIPTVNPTGATMSPGTEVLPYFPDQGGLQTITGGQKVVTFPAGPSNRNAQGQRSGQTTVSLNGGQIVVNGNLSPFPATFPPGSGAVQGDTNIWVAGDWYIPYIGDGAQPTTVSVSAAPFSRAYGPGDTISICIYGGNGGFRTRIYSVTVDWGAGNPSVLDLADMWVNFKVPPIPPVPVMGYPVPIEFGPASPGFGLDYPWALETVTSPGKPENFTAPTIAGFPDVGHVIELADVGDYTTPPYLFNYQWFLNNTAIPGASGKFTPNGVLPSITVLLAWVGKNLKLRLTPIGVGGTAPHVFSNVLGPILNGGVRVADSVDRRVTMGGDARVWT